MASPEQAVGEAVVHLGDHREPVAVEAVDEPEPPQGLGPVELLGQDPPGEPLQLPDVTGRRQGRVAQVEAQVEPVVVHPTGLAEARHPCESLAEPRGLVQLGLGERQHPLEVDAPGLTAQRPGLIDGHRADVHVRPAVLHHEEAHVHRGEPLEVCIGHRGRLPVRRRYCVLRS